MTQNRNEILSNYIDYLYSSNKSYEYIGRYIKAVKLFIDSDYPLSRAGYRKFSKDNAMLTVRNPLTNPALCDFLRFLGIGYKKTKSRDIKPLEKLSAISEKNMKLLNDFIYFLTQEEDYSPHTLDMYSFSVKKYFEYANEISVNNYKGFVKALENEGLSPKTIRLRITALERLSKFVKKPIELKRPKLKKELNVENVPTESDYQKLLEYLKTKNNQDHYFFAKILATTGARVSEFLQFTWEDVIKGEVILKGKGNKYRRFFFNKRLQCEIKEYLKQSPKNGYIAVGKCGRLTTRGLDYLIKSWGNKCGIDKSKMHAHAFRHFFAKMYLKKNNDVVQLADLMGHGSIDTTRIYLQKSYDEQKKEFNRSVTW